MLLSEICPYSANCFSCKIWEFCAYYCYISNCNASFFALSALWSKTYWSTRSFSCSYCATNPFIYSSRTLNSVAIYASVIELFACAVAWLLIRRCNSSSRWLLLMSAASNANLWCSNRSSCVYRNRKFSSFSKARSLQKPDTPASTQFFYAISAHNSYISDRSCIAARKVVPFYRSLVSLSSCSSYCNCAAVRDWSRS